MSLSVCCVTVDAPRRVAAALSLLREVADEIVVAVDSRISRRALAPYANVVDRLLMVEELPPVEVTLQWLHAQCSGEWIFRLAGDEVPSRSLIDELPELIKSRDVVQYHFPRCWVYPDAHHWLDEWPWSPDYRNRLVRADGALWFPGRPDTDAAPDFPTRHVDSPIYCIDLIEPGDEEQNRDDLEPEGVIDTAVDVTADRLTVERRHPEQYASLPPEDVPEEDVGLIASVLSGVRPAPWARSKPSRLVASTEVESFWAGRSIPPEAYRAAIEPQWDIRTMAAGEHHWFRLLVRNLGTEWWPGEEQEPVIRVAYRWLALDGEVIEPEGFRTPFPSPVRPGESCLVAAAVVPPFQPDRYILEFDLVHELVRWFECTRRFEIDVQPSETLPKADSETIAGSALPTTQLRSHS